MKVTGTKEVSIDIDKSQQYKITCDFLDKLFDSRDGRYIDDKGNLSDSWEDGGGSHSWIETKVVRKATKEDKLFYEFIQVLEKKWRDKK